MPVGDHGRESPRAQYAGAIAPQLAGDFGARRRGCARRPASRCRATQNARTALGYASGPGAQSALVCSGLSAALSARLGRLVDKVVPAEFHVDPRERRALNALGETAGNQLAARAIAKLVDVADAVAFMEELTKKLELYGLDLVEPGDFVGGEPTYRLRRGDPDPAGRCCG